MAYAPRIRDLADKRLHPFEKASTYATLEPLIGEPVNVRQIESQWDELLRLATSIRQGTVTASLVLRKLAAYPRQNGLAWGLREIGRIDRTLFTLDWLQSPELRRRVTIGLNKGEAKNALSRAVCFHRRGMVQDRTFDDQRLRAGGLNLVVAAIVLWNTVYLERAVETLRASGTVVPDELLKHLSPPSPSSSRRPPSTPSSPRVTSNSASRFSPIARRFSHGTRHGDRKRRQRGADLI